MYPSQSQILPHNEPERRNSGNVFQFLDAQTGFRTRCRGARLTDVDRDKTEGYREMRHQFGMVRSGSERAEKHPLIGHRWRINARPLDHQLASSHNSHILCQRGRHSGGEGSGLHPRPFRVFRIAVLALVFLLASMAEITSTSP